MTGVIRVIDETKTYGAKGFQKREFVLETAADKFPQQVKFELVKDRCSDLDKFRVNQEVTVSFDVRGNEHGGRYYVSLAAWKLDRVGQSQPQPQRRQESPVLPARSAQVPVGGDNDDEEIPF